MKRRRLTLEYTNFVRAVVYWALGERRISVSRATGMLQNLVQSERQIFACEGKVAFPTFKMATGVANRWHRTAGRRFVYRCVSCSQFHLSVNEGKRSVRSRSRRRKRGKPSFMQRAWRYDDAEV